MCDLASVQRIIDDTAHLHRETLLSFQKTNPHCQVKHVTVTTNDGEKPICIDLTPKANSTNYPTQIHTHLLPAVTDNTPSMTPTAKFFDPFQTHFLTTFYSLRYLAAKEAKTKVLYALNYFRSI